MARDGVPPPPRPNGKPLLSSIGQAWVAFWTSDISGLVLDADRHSLDRLFVMYDLRERMMRAFHDKPFTQGSTGQTVVHPAAKEIASLDARIKGDEERFGITPASRLKLGIVLGAAAKSLEDMNSGFTVDDDEEEVDPRLGRVIDIR